MNTCEYNGQWNLSYLNVMYYRFVDIIPIFLLTFWRCSTNQWISESHGMLQLNYHPQTVIGKRIPWSYSDLNILNLRAIGHGSFGQECTWLDSVWCLLVKQLHKSVTLTAEARLWHALSFWGVSWFKPSGARPVWSSFNEGSDKGEDERAVMRLIPWLEPALGLLLLVTLATDPLSNLVTHGMCAM